VADFFIIGATLVFTLAHVYRWVRRVTTDVRRPPLRLRPAARIAAATAAVGLVATVTLGATHYGGSTHPPPVYRATAIR
jgi:uncharacterized heparinase superfamily protein